MIKWFIVFTKSIEQIFMQRFKKIEFTKIKMYFFEWKSIQFKPMLLPVSSCFIFRKYSYIT